MFEFSLFSIDSMGLRYGASKLFQILIPLLSYIIIRDGLILGVLAKQPIVQHWIQQGSQHPWFQNLQRNFPQLVERTIGFMAWKIGCDLGFFLIVTGLGPWSRSFTWAGLIPYTLIQYVFYYWLGRRVLVEGAPLSPVAVKPARIPTGRPAPWKRWVSKYLHEDMNVTSDTIPLRQVILKPIVDYFGLVLSWSLYTIGMFFSQSGEVNWWPLLHFSFFQMLTFYLVNTYGYVLGFNLGEILYIKLSELQEIWLKLRREKATAEQGMVLALEDFHAPVALAKYPFFDPIQSLIDRYGLTGRWLVSASAGVFCIMILAPTFAGWMFSFESNAQDLWFQSQGTMVEGHRLQIEESFRDDQTLPDAQFMIDQFPTLWADLYLSPSSSDPT
ncbi:MAG: hypothetical protein ACO31I_08455 [Prochlorotrichaceae cyanobacterium]|jgi:hypothetical protein